MFFHSKTYAWAHNEEAHDQSVPQRNTKTVLIERKQVDKKMNIIFADK